MTGAETYRGKGLLGRGVRVYRAATKPRAYNLMLGDRSQVGLV